MFGSGKCFKKDCGCQKFWQVPNSDANICGCEHHEAFHEQKQTEDNSTANNVSLAFLTNNQVSENINTLRSSNVDAFLRSEDLRGRLTAVSTSSSILNNNSNVKKLNFNLQKESSKFRFNLKNKNKKNKIRSVTYEFTLIPKKSISSIPKKGSDLWEQLVSQNLVQKITFAQDSAEYVNDQIVAAFPQLLETGWNCYKTRNTSELALTPFEPESTKDLSYIKRASTSKSKIYIKPITDCLCESSDDSSSMDLSIEILDEGPIEPNGSFRNLMKNFQRTLENRYLSNFTTKIITINENTVSESLLQWAKNTDDKDLLQRPSIAFILEDVTDTGGVFRQVTSMFWNEIYDSPLYFTDGLIENSSECHTLGKVLFWTILHGGMWPQWLHKSQIQYMMDEDIETTKILKDYNPLLYEQLKNKKFRQEWQDNRDVDINIKALNRKEATSYIAEYEIITIRKQALDELRLGFNQFNMIEELKNHYKFQNIVHELYYKLTYDIVIEQFDDEYVNFQAQLHNKPQHQILFDKFKDLLKTMNENELKNVMKFITGAEIIPASPKIKISWIELETDDMKVWFKRLPYASTCGNLLTLCESYEMSSEGFVTFKEDLYTGFANHEGFSEPVYSRNYNSNINLQNEIQSILSRPPSRSTVRSLQMSSETQSVSPRPPSISTVRSLQMSGESSDNAINIEDELELSHQNTNLSRQQSTYRWINITNPLERRTRRRRESANF